MSEEIKKKDDQTLASVSFILGLALVGLAVFVLNTMDTNSDRSNALKRADKYAQRLIDNGFKMDLPQDSSRNPVRSLASTINSEEVLQGPLGIDPWGYPFQYYVDKEKGNLNGKMIVWSSGPDNKFQTAASTLKQDLSQNKNITFTGDDFGKIINFKLEALHSNP